MLPSLSELGWVTDSRNMLAKLLSYYILTDVGQTLTFHEALTSLPYTYHLHINNPSDMVNAVEQDLTRLLERFFEISEVKVKVKEGEGKQVTILIFASAVDNRGVKVSLGKVLEMDTSGLRKTVDINNIGDGEVYLGG